MDGAILRPTEMIDRADALWRWWLAELAALVPQGLRDALRTADDAILIAVQPDDFVVTRRAGVYETVIARIPRDEFAARTLRLSTPHATGLRAWLADPVILQLPAGEAL